MRKVIKISDNGLFVEDVILQDEEITPDDCIETPCPDGFYHPRWNGIEWVEGGMPTSETEKQEIARVKLELKETDYKIIKCSEYSLAGLDAPYNIAELHAERQALRDRVNILETSVD